MKVAFYLKQQDSKSNTSIFARISYCGQKLKYYISEKINPQFWSKETHRAKQTSKFKEYPEFNTRLNNIETAINNVFRKYQNDNGGKEPSTAILKNLLDKEFDKTPESEERERKLKTFWGFFEEFLNRAKNGTRLHTRKHTPLAKGTIKNYENLYNHLKEFETKQRRKIDFDTIDIKFHLAFTDYLATIGHLPTKNGTQIDKGVHINTRGKQITQLKVLLREAFEAGYSTNNIFSHRRFSSSQIETEKIYLTAEEIKSIETLDLSKKKRLERVRDIFVVGCYTSLRYCDLSRFSHEHIKNNVIEIRQQKTGEVVYIPVRKEVRKILDKYPEGLPEAKSNQKFNKYIKEVCALSPLLQYEITENGIKGSKYQFVESHTARRSFATNEYLAGDLQPFEIRAITGHKTDKAFYRYIRMTPKENAANVAKKWEERELKQLSMQNHLKAV